MSRVSAVSERAVVAVNEIFYSIQGEATEAGRPCVLVRLSGCDLRCRWCDTAYAFHEGTAMRVEDVVAEVAAWHCPLVLVTGGEPLLQPAAPTLIRALVEAGREVLVETGGHRDIRELDPRARVVLDVKCPGSGESSRNHWENLERLREGDAVKFVIADRQDYEWARTVLRERPAASGVTAFFSPVHGHLPPRDLAAWILEDGLPVRLQLQIHKLIWGADRRGV